MALVLVNDQFGAFDAFDHFWIQRYRAYRLGAGAHDQRAAFDGADFVHEIGIGPIADETADEIEIVFADFVEHPVDQPLVRDTHR